MNIRALIFDLDGTAIPNRPDGTPSETVITAVRAAEKHIFVSVATGRMYSQCQKILSILTIHNVCILNGGTQLFDPSTKKFIWEQTLSRVAVQSIIAATAEFPYKINSEKDGEKLTLINEYEAPKNASMLVIFAVPLKIAEQIKQKLDAIGGISTHFAQSWTTGFFDLHITHELATKKHAMQALLSMANISPKEVMVVGDSNNDMPLFELAGWKVAMGNGSPELKQRADWIAPSVEKDGLAVAIEKFILNPARTEKLK